MVKGKIVNFGFNEEFDTTWVFIGAKKRVKNSFGVALIDHNCMAHQEGDITDKLVKDQEIEGEIGAVIKVSDDKGTLYQFQMS